MAMLEDILKQSQPGINPQLEEMVARMLAGSGMAGPQAQASAAASAPGSPSAASGGAMPPDLGAGAGQAPGGPGGAPTPPGLDQGGGEGNETYKVLVSRGVPPALAQQALGNPVLMKQLLQQIFKGMQGAQEMPQAAPSSPNRQSAPPLGGGGGYG